MPDVSLAAPLWCAIGASVTGAAHARAGKPKQDALGWRPARGRSVALAVADGHGSPKCFRSERGSQFAVDVTLALLSQLTEQAGDAGTIVQVHDQVKEMLPRQIVERWRRLVEEDLAREPITPEEWATLATRDGESAQKPVRDEPALAYGSTLLAAAATPHFLLVIQNGDGDILSVSQEGVVSRPLPGDARLIANETTSLCSPDAVHNFRVAFHELSAAPPALILLSTDGYANSFQDEAGFLQVGTDLQTTIRAHGMEQVTANLNDWLEHASKEGSGDDVTLGLLVLQGRDHDPIGVAARPDIQPRVLAAIGGGEGVPAAPLPVPRPPRPSVLPGDVTAQAIPPMIAAVPIPQAIPLPPTEPSSRAFPLLSVLAALCVLLMGLLLLSMMSHRRAGPQRHTSDTTQAPHAVDLGLVRAGTTVRIPVSPPPRSPRRCLVRPPMKGLSVRFQGATLLLTVSRGRPPGQVHTEVWLSAGHGGGHLIIPIRATITSAAKRL